MNESPHEKYLKKVSKGTAIVFFGLIISQFLGYLTRLVTVRVYGIENYGLFSIGNAILGIAVVVSMFGIQEAVTRFISFYHSKGDSNRVRSVIVSGLRITLIISLIVAAITIIFSDTIACFFFNEPALEPLIWIFAAMIPLSVIFNNFISVLKGFQLMKYKVYFEDILKSFSTIIFLIIFFWLGFNIIGVVYAYLAGFVITIIVALYIILKRFPVVRGPVKNVAMNREMITFAWPLMIASYVKMVMSWTDTVALGYFGVAFDVGLYNTALPTAGIIYIFAVAFRHMLNPILSELYAKGRRSELEIIFKSTSKWILLLTLPIFLLFILFPDNILGIMFGLDAMAASPVLVILAIGFFSLSLIGASSVMFLVIGKTKISMYNTVAATVVNFVLNIILIPLYGIFGAAIATSSSMILLSFLHIIFCRAYTGLVPANSEYWKIFLSGLFSVGLFYGVIKFVIGDTSWWILVLAFPLFLILYVLITTKMNCLDRDDIMIIRTIEKKSGMKSEKISKIVSKISSK